MAFGSRNHVNRKRLIAAGMLPRTPLLKRLSDWLEEQHWTLQLLALGIVGAVMGLALIGGTMLLRMVP